MSCFAFLMLLWASNIHAHSLQQMVTQISICCKLSATVHCLSLSTSCIILSYTLIPQVINTIVSYILYIYILYSFKFFYCVHVIFSTCMSECMFCMCLCACICMYRCRNSATLQCFPGSFCIVCSVGPCTVPESHSIDHSGWPTYNRSSVVFTAHSWNHWRAPWPPRSVGFRDSSFSSHALGVLNKPTLKTNKWKKQINK